jgi:hypothetical protein
MDPERTKNYLDDTYPERRRLLGRFFNTSGVSRTHELIKLSRLSRQHSSGQLSSNEQARDIYRDAVDLARNDYFFSFQKVSDPRLVPSWQLAVRAFLNVLGSDYLKDIQATPQNEIHIPHQPTTLSLQSLLNPNPLLDESLEPRFCLAGTDEICAIPNVTVIDKSTGRTTGFYDITKSFSYHSINPKIYPKRRTELSHTLNRSEARKLLSRALQQYPAAADLPPIQVVEDTPITLISVEAYSSKTHSLNRREIASGIYGNAFSMWLPRPNEVLLRVLGVIGGEIEPQDDWTKYFTQPIQTTSPAKPALSIR